MEVDQKNLGPEPCLVLDGGNVGAPFYMDLPGVFGVIAREDLQDMATGTEVWY